MAYLPGFICRLLFPPFMNRTASLTLLVLASCVLLLSEPCYAGNHRMIGDTLRLDTLLHQSSQDGPVPRPLSGTVKATNASKLNSRPIVFPLFRIIAGCVGALGASWLGFGFLESRGTIVGPVLYPLGFVFVAIAVLLISMIIVRFRQRSIARKALRNGLTNQ